MHSVYPEEGSLLPKRWFTFLCVLNKRLALWLQCVRLLLSLMRLKKRMLFSRGPAPLQGLGVRSILLHITVRHNLITAGDIPGSMIGLDVGWAGPLQAQRTERTQRPRNGRIETAAESEREND